MEQNKSNSKEYDVSKIISEFLDTLKFLYKSMKEYPKRRMESEPQKECAIINDSEDYSSGGSNNGE